MSRRSPQARNGRTLCEPKRLRRWARPSRRSPVTKSRFSRSNAPTAVLRLKQGLVRLMHSGRVAECGKYDTQNEDSVALSPRCVDADEPPRARLLETSIAYWCS